MYTTEKETRQFDLNSSKDLAEYDLILNDPLCTIVREFKEKIVDKIFEEGKLAGVNERLVLVVTWQRKTLL